MSDVPEIPKTGTKGMASDNAALNEAAWQKWVNKNKGQDAARRMVGVAQV